MGRGGEGSCEVGLREGGGREEKRGGGGGVRRGGEEKTRGDMKGRGEEEETHNVIGSYLTSQLCHYISCAHVYCF